MSPSSQPQRTKLILMLEDRGVVDVEEQRWLCAQHAGRPLTSRRELTSLEAGSFIERLERLTAADLARVLSTRLPDGVLACGGSPTPGDAAQIREFAAALEARGSAPASGAADSGVAGRRTRRSGVRCETPAPVADHGPEHPAPDPEVHAAIATALVELGTAAAVVEAAAQAAVDRYRARDGAIPDPPAPGEVPPRVPAVLPPRADRYCPPSICWCGSCPSWKPIPQPNWSKVPGAAGYVDTSWAP